MRLKRSVQDDFAISFQFRTLHLGCGAADQWYQGAGLVDAEVEGATADFGVSFGQGRIMFGIGKPDITIASRKTFNDGIWHEVLATRSRVSGRFELVVDGKAIGSKVGQKGSLTASKFIDVGRIQTKMNYFTGEIRDVCITDKSGVHESSKACCCIS